MNLDDATRDQIQKLVDDNPVLLFMKGNRQAPQCGFSARVIELLDAHLAEYETLDVLSDGAIREGIKVFSEWPTIPQLYVKGEFVGGCDIIVETADSGELFEMLGIEPPPRVVPKVTITDSAAVGLRQAAEQNAGSDNHLKLSIGKDWQPKFAIGRESPLDVAIESGGVRILIDRVSAPRADGITIDLVETAQGRGFQVNNPNAPSVGELSVQGLRGLLASDEAFEFVDVRTPEEFETAHINGANLIDTEQHRRLMGLPKDTKLVFMCHHGPRAVQLAGEFLSEGFRNVHNVTGGIHAWSLEIDSDVPQY